MPAHMAWIYRPYPPATTTVLWDKSSFSMISRASASPGMSSRAARASLRSAAATRSSSSASSITLAVTGGSPTGTVNVNIPAFNGQFQDGFGNNSTDLDNPSASFTVAGLNTSPNGDWALVASQSVSSPVSLVVSSGAITFDVTGYCSGTNDFHVSTCLPCP